MHPEDIKASLKKAGSNQARIAESLGLSRSTVAHVINGRSRSRRVAREISRATDLPVSTLWPGRYADDSEKPTNKVARGRHSGATR